MTFLLQMCWVNINQFGMFCIEWSPPHVCGDMLIHLKSGTAEVWHIRLSSTGSACACKNWSMLVPMLVNADQSLPLFCPKIYWSTDHWSVDKNWPMLLLWEVADPVLALFWSRFLNMQTLKLISSAHFQLDVIIDGACMYCIPYFSTYKELMILVTCTPTLWSHGAPPRGIWASRTGSRSASWR